MKLKFTFSAYCYIVRRLFSKHNMVRVLNVAEKNDAAKSITEVMTNGQYRKRDGFSKFNKIYEFEFNMLNQLCNMVFTSVSGHLLGLEFPIQYRKWYSCSPAQLFDIPVEKYCPPDYQAIKKTLEHEIHGCQYLVIWTDCDREGENIGFEVIQVCRSVKPNIPVYRAKFSEITRQAVSRAVQNLVQPDQLISDAVDVRMELDLRIGAAFTRFQTLRLTKVFPQALAQQLISYGSCQFPTLGFVVERYKQVQAFIPEPFWKLKVKHEHDNEVIEFSWKRNRLFDHMMCLVLYEHCIENPLATVVNVHSKNKNKWRPVPLDTVIKGILNVALTYYHFKENLYTELEKLASRKLQISAKETMRIAENLYSKGFISYPRTETNIFPKDFDLATIVSAQTQDPNWGDFAQQVLEHGPSPRNGNKTDKAHPPIHPTKYTCNLQGNDQRVYEFIVRHFLACCSQDAQGLETTVEIDIAQERFTIQGLMILAKNYLQIYPYERWSSKEIPLYQIGDSFEPSALEMVAGETSPPLLLTEADLIALMEKHGIGTDATHAEHIETIKSRMYVGLRPDGRFVPGQLGMGLVEGYDNMGYEMSKPNLRAELEADLKAICEGRKAKNEVLSEQVKKYKVVFLEACHQALKLDEALSQYLGNAQPFTQEPVQAVSSVMPCQKCGHNLTLRTRKDGKGFFIGCSNYPICRHVLWLPDSVLEVTVEADICPTCQPGPVHLLHFRFRPGSVSPIIPINFTGCIGGCDDMLIETLGISRPLVPNATPAGRNAGTLPLPQTSDVSLTPQHEEPNNAGPISTTKWKPNNGPQNAASSKSSNWKPNNGPQNTRPSNATKWKPDNGPNVVNPSSNTAAHDFSTHAGSGLSSKYGRGGSTVRLPLDNMDSNSGLNLGHQDCGIVCLCGEDALLLTVRKECPNTGRQFYKCQKSQGEGCNFFMWADEQDGKKQGFRSTQPTKSEPNPRIPPSPHLDSVKCNCGMLARQLTVQKEGPNTGRGFFSCPKPRGEGCSFFKWADDAQNSGRFSHTHKAQSVWSNRHNERPKEKKRSITESKRPRHCGLCGEEGHTKKKCPHKDT